MRSNPRSGGPRTDRTPSARLGRGGWPLTGNGDGASEPSSKRWRTRSGCLVQLWQRAVLLLGESGAGKTDCLLSLADRGHQVLADDAVEWRSNGSSIELRCPETVRGVMAIRGLGLVSGWDSTGSVLPLGIAIELVRPTSAQWQRWPVLQPVWTRVGLSGDVGIRVLQLPVAPGRPTALLIEQAVRVHGTGVPPAVRQPALEHGSHD